MNTEQFLEQLFPDIEDVGHFVIWTTDSFTNPQKEKYTNRSAFFTNYKKAAEYAHNRTENFDVYVSTGVFKENLGAYRKGSEKEVVAIPGLWADLDIKHKDAHKKDNLPTSQQEAVGIIKKALPPHLVPTITVHSGHGLQAWWLFKELLEIETEQEQRNVKRLVTRFHRTLKYTAGINGWDVDAMIGLCSLLRVPGTQNNKVPDHVKPVEVIEYENRRYNQDDIEEYLIEIKEPIKLAGDKGDEIDYGDNPLNLVIDHEAKAPEPKLSDLIEMDEKFRAAVQKIEERSRIDKSLSSYEMTMCNLAKSYGWTDQEICNTIISFRRKHATTDKEWKKGLRVDYLNRTISKAKECAPKEKNLREIEELSQEIKQESITPEIKDEDKIKSRKEHIRDQISDALGVRVNSLVKYLGDNPVYEISVNGDNTIQLGNVDQVINQHNLRKKIAAHCNIYINRYKANEWDMIATNMLQLIQEVDPGTETRASEIIRSWVVDFWYSRGHTEDLEVAMTQRKSYFDGESCFVFGSELRNVMLMNGTPFTPQAMAPILKSLGSDQKSIYFTPDDGKRIHRRVYDVTQIINGETHESTEIETSTAEQTDRDPSLVHQ